MKRSQPEIVEVDVGKLEELVRRAEQKAFEPQDYQTIRAVLESYFYVTNLIDQKNTTLARLRTLLFGARTEKTAGVIGCSEQASATDGGQESSVGGNAADSIIAESTAADPTTPPATAVPAGHGRHGVADYPGARRVEVSHESLQAGDACPACPRGTVYAAAPGVLIRFVGQAPVQATIYQLQKLRCGLCGQVFTAEPPAGVGVEKYDATVASMIGLLKYGSGFPFNRLEGLQGNLQIPLPASTQWEIVSAPVAKLKPVYEELIRQAAQGEVLQNDDTTVKILAWMEARAQAQAFQQADAAETAESQPAQRKGLFTSGVIATRGGQRIALLFSGRQHAGENLQEVLRRRAADLPLPIQMCDALSRNLPRELQTIVAHCLAHARRQFVDVHEQFPAECRHVLEALQVIYRNDALARERTLSPADRLAFHQAESGPTMQRLHEWLRRQIDERRVEPNSGLGSAIQYLCKHWQRLTLFLQQPGAPLDNNLCERALKKAILHRKNALFYKTQHGARVGDLYMSLIHTCELGGVNPFDYLTQLQRHADQLAAAPERWMPWNYRDNITHASDAA